MSDHHAVTCIITGEAVQMSEPRPQRRREVGSRPQDTGQTQQTTSQMVGGNLKRTERLGAEPEQC